ncbi:MAG: C2H2-type zinc finger protein [Candidatus Bathyarchaeota archaeon]|nr:C2H2-type zinc finger protein [Candidatus Bathyarchaeota archaeon]
MPNKTEVETLFICIVCGKSFRSQRGLAGHMRIHKDVKFKRTTIVVPDVKWQNFKELCKKHHTTTCAVINAVIDSMLSWKTVSLTSPNPITIQVIQEFGGKPRSKNKYKGILW